MTGYLIPCPEQNFRAFFIGVGILDGLDFGPCRWMGLSGYCKICVEEYGVRTTAPWSESRFNNSHRSKDRQLTYHLDGIEMISNIANCLQMSTAVPFRTYNDLEFLEGTGGLTSSIFAVKLAEPIAYPSPSQSIQYSSTPNDGVTREILDFEIANSPSPLR